MHSTWLRFVGNCLILLSIMFFIFMGYPLFRVYFLTPPVVLAKTPSESFRILIPSIRADAPVVENVDPWNEAIYGPALHHGVAQAQGFNKPGEKGTTFLFAHSSGSPWDQMYYNTVFLRLGELQLGDEVILENKKKRYTYRIIGKKEVWPDEVSALEHSRNELLILQTCTPIGTSLKRLLVYAEPVR